MLQLFRRMTGMDSGPDVLHRAAVSRDGYRLTLSQHEFACGHLGFSLDIEKVIGSEVCAVSVLFSDPVAAMHAVEFFSAGRAFWNDVERAYREGTPGGR